MTTKQVNYVNIGLMIFSAAIAFVIPFELFLFSYAVLGPLHYLTEISWLHKRKYFSPKKKDYILLLFLTVIIVVPALLGYLYSAIGVKDEHGNTVYTSDIANFLNGYDHIIPALMFFAFAGSAVLILVKDSVSRLIAFIVIGIIGALVNSQYFVTVLFTMFLPTLIHVFLFTGAFILVGALKSKSTSGYLSILVFIGCALSFFFLFPDGAGYHISNYAKNSYNVSFFSLNQQIFKTFLHQNAGADVIYGSSAGILITRFIAYAYTYHYLNWFSKTSVIKWHEVPRSWLIAIFGLWILAVVLYYTNYQTGLMALYFLSFLHVVLEFPLNFQSFKQIGEQVKLRLGKLSPGSGGGTQASPGIKA